MHSRAMKRDFKARRRKKLLCFEPFACVGGKCAGSRCALGGGGEWPIMLTLLVSLTSRSGQICFASVLWQVLTVTIICMNYSLHEYFDYIQLCKALKHLVQSVVFLTSGSIQKLSACYQIFQPFFSAFLSFLFLLGFFLSQQKQYTCMLFSTDQDPWGKNLGSPSF
jgi:hypothetical protein